MALQCISILSVLCLAQTAEHLIPRRRGAREAYLAEMPKGSRLTKLARRAYTHLSLAVIKKGRRTKAVKNTLVSSGIAPQAVTVNGAGEGGLLIETPDQTKNEKNRRVQIVVQ
jgi:hypothetical protein